MIHLDDLLGGLHEDRCDRLRSQLVHVQREINTRRLVSAERTIALYVQINELTTEILRLHPEHEHAPDPHRVMRQRLEVERRVLSKELVDEVRERWRDSQELLREERTLRDQLAEEHRQYERHTRDYAS